MNGMNHDHFTSPGTVISDYLASQNLSQWGFVLIRCTYASQPKWDAFLAKAQSYASEHFDEMGMPHIYERIKWTVLEDAETLDGADIVQASRVFRDWVSGEGRAELRGSVFEGDARTWVHCPRYTFFGRVDEESLESVVGDETGAMGCFCKIVRGDAVVLGDEDEDEDEDEDDDEEDMLDLEKKVKLYKLVELYALLAHVDEWYNILMDFTEKDIAMF